MASAEARRELPVLSLDVVNDRRPRPGQQRWNDQSDTFTRTCGREAEDMFGAIVAQIRSAEPAKDYAGIAEHAGLADFTCIGPAGRAKCFCLAAFACAPDGHGDGDDEGQETARDGNECAVHEDRGRVGVECEPPPEEGRRRIDGGSADPEPGLPQFRLIAECGGGALGGAPDGEQDEN